MCSKQHILKKCRYRQLYRYDVYYMNISIDIFGSIPLQSKGYSRVITPTQFGRILHFLTLKVAPEDFKLLCRKFADRATGDVNYPAFVQCVDQGM